MERVEVGATEVEESIEGEEEILSDEENQHLEEELKEEDYYEVQR